MDKKKQSLEKSQELINSEEFKGRHRALEKYFTRRRKLVFSLLIVLIIRKSVKSIQLILNELSLEMDTDPVSAAAFTKARAKLKHTAFIELNREAVVKVCYGDGDFNRYRGFRVLGIDGSKVLLPDTKEIIKTFGQIGYSSNGKAPEGQHAYGVASVMYDVLNRIALDSTLSQARAYEVDLAIEPLQLSAENDLLLGDRGYPSYRVLATVMNEQRHLVIRCSAKSFAQARTMLRGEGANSQIVTLKPHPSRIKAIQTVARPDEITVRFVRVTLETGECEVLVTSLTDESTWPSAEFKDIYWMRWGTEGFDDILKTRLNLENFTGQTAESVYQDFYASVYLTGLESILTADTDAQLSEKTLRHPQQVNRAVSFNAIKPQALDLLFQPGDIHLILTKLEQLFLTNPTCHRENRMVPRKKKSSRHLLNFWKRRRKQAF